DGGADRLHELQDPPLVELAVAGELVERDAVDQLHRVEVDALEHAAVVDAGDLGVLEAGGQLDLAVEAQAGPLGDAGGAHELEGDLATGGELQRPPDDAHAA